MIWYRKALAAAWRAVLPALAGVVVAGSLAAITLAPSTASAQQTTTTLRRDCNVTASSNPEWAQSNDDRLCTLLDAYPCRASDSSGCTVTVNFAITAKADNASLLAAIHAWVGIGSDGQWAASPTACDGSSSSDVVRCSGGATATVATGANIDVAVVGSVYLSGVGIPRTANVSATSAISVSYTAPCSVVPCFVAIFVNGATPAPGQDKQDTRWGIGIITMAPRPVRGQGWTAPFAAGSWAATYNDDVACWDGNQDVGSCQAAGVFTHPEVVTLTAHAVQKGGFSANASEKDEDPGWGSDFVKWGGDCASAGTSDSCTLHVGVQRSTVEGASGSLSLSVTATFQVRSDSSGESGF
jgi:hypothetical protein